MYYIWKYRDKDMQIVLQCERDITAEIKCAWRLGGRRGSQEMER